MSVLGLDHVQVAAPAGCEPAARRFFGELLGLREVEKPAALRDRGGAWFALPSGQQLHIGVLAGGFAPALKAHPALRVAPGGLDGLAARLVAAGHEIQWDETVPAERRFFTHDPWGNRLELLSERG
jgi:catechol 2,3-dioxygenase-like lactoylglutathione lyase family enzyme